MARYCVMRMRGLFLALVNIWAVGLVTACTAFLPAPVGAPSVTREAVTATPTPEIAQDFTLTALDGRTFQLRALRGQWVIINFWATWCGPCRAEMPYLQGVADAYPEHVTLLGINLREDAATVGAFVDEVGITFPILLNPDDATLLWYSTRALPLTFVVAPDGAVALFQYGPLAPDEFDPWLASHLPQPAPAEN